MTLGAAAWGIGRGMIHGKRVWIDSGMVCGQVMFHEVAHEIFLTQVPVNSEKQFSYIQPDL